MSQDRDARNVLSKRCWVFDLDGTLTLPVHDFTRIRSCLGVPEGIDILRHLDSLPENEARPLHDRLDVMELHYATETRAAPGARELVELLSRRGCNLGVLTRNRRDVAFVTLEHIGLERYFLPDAILGRDEARPKPDPDGIYKLASLWGTLPEEVVMAGDYLYDLQAGQAAGALTIHVHGDRDRRWPEWTDLCVESLGELVEKLGYCADMTGR